MAESSDRPSDGTGGAPPPSAPADDLTLGRPTPTAPPASKARNESLDVIKAVLITMVVYAHIIEHFAANTEHATYWRVWYSAMSLFAIPLFALLSGLLAGPLLGDGDYRKLFSRLLLPLVCLQPFYLVLIQLVEGDAERHLLDPQWMLWFLLSLVCWRLMLPLFLRIPAPLTVSIAIALAAGYAEYIGPDLSLSRTVYFFPFFLAGFLWRKKLLDVVSRARVLWGVLFVVLMVGIVLWCLHGLQQAVFYGSEGYDQVAVLSDYPALGRLALMTLSTLSLLAFMAIMPRKSKVLARIGRRTLTVFILHGPVVLVSFKVFKMLGWTDPSPALTPVFIAVAMAISWGLAGLDGPFNRFFDGLAAFLTRRVRV